MKKTLSIILVVLTAICALAFSASAALANTWKDPSVERFDGNASNEIAYRFATQGTGKLIAINPLMAGTSGSFDVIVYKWSNNYANTIAGVPIDTVKIEAFDQSDAKWSSFAGKAIVFNNGGLPAGEYLIVMKNFTTEWAICNYIFSANPGFKVYKNGVGEDKSLQWQFEFEDGGWYCDAPLSADVEAPISSSAESTAPDTDNGNNPTTSDAMLAASAIVLIVGVAVVICKGKKD